jgi:hypothetical protein
MRCRIADSGGVSAAKPHWRRRSGRALLIWLLLGLVVTTLIRAQAPQRPALVGVTALPSVDGSSVAELRCHRAVTLVVPGLDPRDTRLAPGDFTLHGELDPRYRRGLAATRLGFDRQVTGFVDERTAVSETRLHLLFPHPLRDGLRYRLNAPAAGLNNLPVVWRADQVSGSIQLNQVGYAPQAGKYAYVGNWLGSAGAMPVDADAFRIVDVDSGDTVLEGSLVVRALDDPWSGNHVYSADFSSLHRPGRYAVQVAGVGQSDSFRIGTDVYDTVYRTTARHFYHHRNATAVSAPWAAPGHERPGGIPGRLDAVFHPAVGRSPLGNGEAANGYHAVSGGWFDAGDYGQYMPNAAPVWYVVGAAFDLAPRRFRDGELNIPESGNGLPDLLDELEWGMDWVLDMQDQADGGVYFRVASASWDSTLPHQVDSNRFIAEKTTHATAAFAAVTAIHARLLAERRPARAAAVLAAAEHAWQFLQNHPQWPEEGQLYRNPTGIHAGEYNDPSARDNILWAAAELYRSTGESKYHDAYKTLVDKVRMDPTGVVSFRDQGMAAHWAYLMTSGHDREETLVERARELVLAAADWRIRKMREHPYRAPVHQHRGFLGWGSFAHSSRATLTLFQAWHLTGEPDYLEWAWLTPHPQLGANPQSLSYITGVGARSPRFPLDKLSQLDNIDSPLPGIAVNGPHAWLPELWPAMTEVNRAYFPPVVKQQPGSDDDGYPVLRRYTDAHYLPPMSEPTIAEAARTAVAYGLLRSAEAASPATERVANTLSCAKPSATASAHSLVPCTNRTENRP